MEGVIIMGVFFTGTFSLIIALFIFGFKSKSKIKNTKQKWEAWLKKETEDYEQQYRIWFKETYGGE